SIAIEGMDPVAVPLTQMCESYSFWLFFHAILWYRIAFQKRIKYLAAEVFTGDRRPKTICFDI
ncbi:MAG: hypothetical protein ACYC8S_03685, partial [Minisyncoccota bacterium]